MIPTPYWLSRCFLSTDGLVLLLLDIYHSGILSSKTLVNSLFKGPWWIHSGILSWTSLVSRGSREVLSGISFPATFYPRPHWPLGAHGTCLRALATRLHWSVRSTIHTVYSDIRYKDTGQSRSTIHIVCSGIGYSDTGHSWSTIHIVCSGIGYSDTGQSRSTIHIVCSGIGYSDTGQSWSTIRVVCSGIRYSATLVSYRPRYYPSQIIAPYGP